MMPFSNSTTCCCKNGDVPESWEGRIKEWLRGRGRGGMGPHGRGQGGLQLTLHFQEVDRSHLKGENEHWKEKGHLLT